MRHSPRQLDEPVCKQTIFVDILVLALSYCLHGFQIDAGIQATDELSQLNVVRLCIHVGVGVQRYMEKCTALYSALSQRRPLHTCAVLEDFSTCHSACPMDQG